MSRIAILGTSVADADCLTSEGPRLDRLPGFRSASPLMKLGYLALEPMVELIPQSEREQAALVVGSSYGELETTQAFLLHLANTGAARPLLFQNSLHNATTGFLALRFGLHGPSLTVSNRLFTAESSLESAILALETQAAAFTLIVNAERCVPKLESMMRPRPGEEQAAALLLCTELTAQKRSIRALAYLETLSFGKNAGVTARDDSGEYDPRDLSTLARALLDSNGKPGAHRLELSKPGHAYSTLTWSCV